MTRGYRVQKTRAAFVVINAEGDRVSPFLANELAAERERKRLQDALDARKRAGFRACLCCEASFWSHGIHNRLCDGCRDHATRLGREMAG
ncbi:hypothetical protein ROE7235_03087 [Roseibaca ekhonensis]|uniref:Uncharacterized protein n=1 Tax=Roseinatronobacter ekhonensis TaxID=254356 RepID=A0A3B0MIC8_9RHOB|nr:hypothetical protein [Roseibaca ekhonensis]SUZ33318.1 hypothetical protein ROE7235_03087 [Roseibaca ekhonensis]